MPKLTPYTQIVEEFDEAFLDSSGDWHKADPLQVKNFLLIALKNRDEEWRKMIDGVKKFDAGGFSGTSLTFNEMAYNQAIYDIIKASHEK